MLVHVTSLVAFQLPNAATPNINVLKVTCASPSIWCATESCTVPTQTTNTTVVSQPPAPLICFVYDVVVVVVTYVRTNMLCIRLYVLCMELFSTYSGYIFFMHLWNHYFNQVITVCFLEPIVQYMSADCPICCCCCCCCC